jgi:NADH-quinone oxidoreductase subunit K
MLNISVINDIGLTHYLVLSALLFVCGVAGVLLRRNAIVILILS